MKKGKETKKKKWNSKKNSIVLIDVFNLLYRMYFVHTHLSNKKGEHTGAIFGFFKMLKYYKERLRTKKFILVWDTGSEQNWRLKFDSLYKANRRGEPITDEDKKKKKDLDFAKKMVSELAFNLGYANIMKNGNEADDLIGVFINKYHRHNVKIISMDKDFMQLVNDKSKIRLLRPGIGRGSYKIYNENAVVEEFGVLPKDFSKSLALCGDKADNVPGIKGYGYKTAAKLINNEIGFEKAMEEKLTKEQKKRFETNMILVDLKTVPVDIDLKDFIIKKTPDLKKADKIFSRLEFKSLVAKDFAIDNKDFGKYLKELFLLEMD